MRPSLLLAVLLAAATFATTVAADQFPALRDSFDPKLQKSLQQRLAKLGLQKAVSRGKLSVALVDITDIHSPRVAAVNGDQMRYAASLPKIAILLGAFVEIERGRLALDAQNRDSLSRMIRVSSNREATRMLNKVGKQRLIEILQAPRFRLYDAKENGGLWVGKEYGKSPAYKRDPLHNLSHGATALQTARFYYLLESERLVNHELTQEMKDMLADPAINHKFVKGLESRPGVTMYRKSGTWRNWHADSAIVEDGRYKYIIVALAEDPNGGRWLSNLAAPLHDLIVPQQVAMAKR